MPLGVACTAYSNRQPPLVPVAQQIAERRLVARRGDDQKFADAGRHQRRQRIINHRLVVDRQQLLRQRHGDRVQAGAGAARQDNSLALFHYGLVNSV